VTIIRNAFANVLCSDLLTGELIIRVFILEFCVSSVRSVMTWYTPREFIAAKDDALQQRLTLLSSRDLGIHEGSAL